MRPVGNFAVYVQCRHYSTAPRHEIGPNWRAGRTFQIENKPGIRYPAVVVHGAAVQPDHVRKFGLNSPNRDPIDTTDPDVMREALDQHLVGPHEDHALSLRRQTTYYGSQFVATSKSREIGEEFALWNPKDDRGYIYFIDLAKLARKQQSWFIDTDCEHGSGHPREKEVPVLHHVPPDCVIGWLEVHRTGPVGVRADPDDKFVRNPDYVPDPEVQRDEL